MSRLVIEQSITLTLGTILSLFEIKEQKYIVSTDFGSKNERVDIASERVRDFPMGCCCFLLSSGRDTRSVDR